MEAARYYPHGKTAAHVLGYVGATKEQRNYLSIKGVLRVLMGKLD